MLLSERQRACVAHVLRRAEIADPRVAPRLLRALSLTIGLWTSGTRRDLPAGQDWRRLSELQDLLAEEDLPVGQIRALVVSLSPQAQLCLLRAAHLRWPSVFASRDCDLAAWARSCPPGRLRRRLAALAPLAGAPPGGQTGAYAAETGLVAYLAADWTWATGRAALAGDAAFRDLVHHVFSWVTRKKADTAIERYQAALQRSPGPGAGRQGRPPKDFGAGAGNIVFHVERFRGRSGRAGAPAPVKTESRPARDAGRGLS